MGSLRTVAWGVLVVGLDLKIDQVDLIADPVGWGMILVALLGLREVHRAFRAGAWAAAVGLVVSVPAWAGASGLPFGVPLGLAELAVVVSVCTALRELVPTRRLAAERIRGLSVGLAAALVLLFQCSRRGPTEPAPLAA